MSQITCPGILSFPTLFTPRLGPNPKPGEEPRYSCTLVFTPEHQKHPKFAELKAAIIAKAKETFGDQWQQVRFPLRKCSEKPQYGNFPDGSLFLNLWTKQKPGVIGPDQEDIMASGDVWAGQIARVSYNPWTYNTSGNRGVSVGLNNVQILKLDCERLDGRANAKHEFGAEPEPEFETAVLAAKDDIEDDIPF